MAFIFWVVSFFTSSVWATVDVNPEKPHTIPDVHEIKFIPQVWEKSGIHGLLTYNPSGTLLAESVRLGELAAENFGPNIRLLSSKGYLLRTLQGNEDSIKIMRFSDDGSLIAAVDRRLITIWSVATGDILSSWHAGKTVGGIESLWFSKNGKGVITAESPGEVVVWDLYGKPIKSFSVHGPNYIHPIWLANNGNSIVSYDTRIGTRTIKVWDLNGAMLREFTAPDLSAVLGTNREGIICYNEVINGQALIKSYISIWDINGNMVRSFDLKVNNRAYTTIFTPIISDDGRYIASDEHVWNQMGEWLFSFPEQDPKQIAINTNGEVVTHTWTGELEVRSVINKSLSQNIKVDINRSMVVGMIGNKLIVTPSLRLFDLSGRFVQRVSTATETFRAVVASPDGAKIAAYEVHSEAASVSDNVYLWDKDWKLLKIFGNVAAQWSGFSRITRFAFSPDSKYFAIIMPDKVKIWDLEKGDFIMDISMVADHVRNLYFTPEGYLAIGGFERVTLWDPKTKIIYKNDVPTIFSGVNARTYNLIRFNGEIDNSHANMAYSPETNMFAVRVEGGGIRVIDHATGKVIKETSIDSRKITGLYFSNDGKFLIVSGEDNTITIWNALTWQSLRVISNVNDEWLAYTPDGYFDASPHGGELVMMVNGMDAYGVDQFAVRNNRPDLILERMGLSTPEQITFYNLLYQKRLLKLGLTEADLSSELHVPEAKITGTKQNGKFFDIAFSLSDGKSLLKRYNFYINDVPLFGSMGKEITGNSFRGTEKIELTTGKNKIELSAMNNAGAESYRALTYADYGVQEKGSLYYLAFGASKYKDSKLNLNYADKDVQDLETLFSKMRSAYTDVHTKALLNAEVTSDTIKNARDFLKDAQVDDTVVLAIAGHGGYTKGRNAKYYYVAYDTDVDDLAGTGVDFDTIEALLDGIKPRRKLFLMDTCESGELDESVYDNYFTLANARSLKPRTYRKPMKARGDGGAKSRSYVYEKDRYIYNNLTRRTGAVVFSSSKGGEISYESSNIQNGFFTKAIIAALTDKTADKNGDGRIDSVELREFVGRTVAVDTRGLQHPTIDRDNLYQKIDLPLVIGK